MRIKYTRKRLFFVFYRSPQVRTQEGAKPPLEKFFVPTGKLCWTYFETIGYGLKNCPLLESSSLPLVSQTGYGPGSPANVKFSFPAETLSNA